MATTKSGNIEARNLLGRAITINPDFAAAHAFIGFTHVNDYIIGWAEIPERSLQTGLEIASGRFKWTKQSLKATIVLAIALLFHREHRQGSCRGAAQRRPGAQFRTRASDDRSYADFQR